MSVREARKALRHLRRNVRAAQRVQDQLHGLDITQTRARELRVMLRPARHGRRA